MPDRRLSDRFELQGHRGARGLVPENTLVSFEKALDLGVSSIETDIHLTADGIPVLYHDPRIDAAHCRLIPGAHAPAPDQRPPIVLLKCAQLAAYAADQNPDPSRFPGQSPEVTLLAKEFSQRLGVDAFAIPRLVDLLELVTAYGGEPGIRVGKSEAQVAKARRTILDLELKRVAFYPQAIGDAFDGSAMGLLELRVLEAAESAGLVSRCRIRSFDHRSVRTLTQAKPGLEAGVLIAETAPVAPSALVESAGAQVYCPDYRFLDRAQVREAHEHGFRVIPWTVNEPGEWEILVDWGIDGITTDFPDRLAEWLTARSIAF